MPLIRLLIYNSGEYQPNYQGGRRMSNYESMNGKAKLKGADFAALRKELIEAFNKDLAPIPAKVLKQEDVKKANSRTLSFPFINYQEREGKELGFIITEGAIQLTKEDNTLRFYTQYNNHTVDRVADTYVYNVLMRFFNNMPDKGSIYGAETAYRSEYHVDEYDNPETSYDYYGAWKRKQKVR